MMAGENRNSTKVLLIVLVVVAAVAVIYFAFGAVGGGGMTTEERQAMDAVPPVPEGLEPVTEGQPGEPQPMGYK